MLLSLFESLGADFSEANNSTRSHDDDISIIDLFAGPRGLGEGFSAFSHAPRQRFDVRLSIEKDPTAFQTLQLRAFFQSFPRGEVPDEYYSVLRGEISPTQLYERFPAEHHAAKRKTWNVELGSKGLPAKELDERIIEAVGNSKNWILIGGPPCQAFSMAGRYRDFKHLVAGAEGSM